MSSAASWRPPLLPPATRTNDGSKRCSWRDADDPAMIEALRKGKDDGFQSDSGWKPQVWAMYVRREDSGRQPRCPEDGDQMPGPLRKDTQKCAKFRTQNSRSVGVWLGRRCRPLMKCGTPTLL
ncbi:hypothetical protein B0H17DRAFT_1038528 [Mycena rosella]|uniref:Uncharacterized protein n=1 Tax=Mycena rosella TaxID=1033263 RepID=A0AAD7GT69_MYCRO|nr:hypothetical protein B0H17DRAFT_1038528 [Mycena rosella]